MAFGRRNVLQRISRLVARPANAGLPTSLGSLRSWSDDAYYAEFCRRAATDSSVFERFKRSPIYRRILEHVDERQGRDYLAVICRDNPDLLEPKLFGRVRENDCLGSPQTYAFPSIGPTSPTTLRYLKVCSDLKRLFGTLDGLLIAEIGGGYGGQCLVLDRIWQTSQYWIFDLDPVLLLIQRYLEHFLLQTSYVPTTLNRFAMRPRPFDLVISNYAFSELPRPLQNKYLDKVILSATRGYLTMNSGWDGSKRGEISHDELRRLLPGSVVLSEVPLTSESNYILAWGPEVSARA